MSIDYKDVCAVWWLTKEQPWWRRSLVIRWTRQDVEVCGHQSSPFQSFLTHAQWTYEPSGHHSKDGGYIWTQQHELPLTKADMSIVTANSRDQLCVPDRAPLSGRKRWPPDGRLIALDRSHLGRGGGLCSLEEAFILGKNLFCLLSMLLPKPPSVDFCSMSYIKVFL